MHRTHKGYDMHTRITHNCFSLLQITKTSMSKQSYFLCNFFVYNLCNLYVAQMYPEKEGRTPSLESQIHAKRQIVVILSSVFIDWMLPVF